MQDASILLGPLRRLPALDAFKYRRCSVYPRESSSVHVNVLSEVTRSDRDLALGEGGQIDEAGTRIIDGHGL